MHDLSFLMDHIDEKDKTVARDLHLTNSMSNLYNNTANLLGSFTEGTHANISNVSNINQSQDLILDQSIIPSHLKKDIAQKEGLFPPSGEKLPSEFPGREYVSRKDERLFRAKHWKSEQPSQARKKTRERMELPEMNKVLKSLDEED